VEHGEYGLICCMSEMTLSAQLFTDIKRDHMKGQVPWATSGLLSMCWHPYQICGSGVL